MPELPDVEGFKRYFARHAAGRRVRGVEALNRDGDLFAAVASLEQQIPLLAAVDDRLA